MGIIYLVTNKVNKKQYIGKTVTGFKKRKGVHISTAKANRNNSDFHNAIRKYGEENFEWEIIDKCEDKKKLNELEVFYIQKYNTFKNGYNMTLGGMGLKGWVHKEETKRKMSEAMIGERNPAKRPEVQNKIRKTLTGQKGTKEQMKNKSKACRGRGLFGFTGGCYARKKANPWTKVWYAQINYNGKGQKFLGCFHDPLSCQIVYDLVWPEIYGNI